jgi:hypothetical protein
MLKYLLDIVCSLQKNGLVFEGKCPTHRDHMKGMREYFCRRYHDHAEEEVEEAAQVL